MRIQVVYECENCKERFDEVMGFGFSIDTFVHTEAHGLRRPHKCGTGFVGVGKCVAVKEMDREYAIQNS